MELYTKNRACPCLRCRANFLFWPVILIVWGLLGLLDQFTRINFGETWPVFMIVGGAMWFVSTSGSLADHRQPTPPAPPVIGVAVPPPASTEMTSQEQVPHV
jgi:hypothetical protein